MVNICGAERVHSNLKHSEVHTYPRRIGSPPFYYLGSHDWVFERWPLYEGASYDSNFGCPRRKRKKKRNLPETKSFSTYGRAFFRNLKALRLVPCYARFFVLFGRKGVLTIAAPSILDNF